MTDKPGEYEAVFMDKRCHWWLQSYPNPPAGYGAEVTKLLQDAFIIDADLKLTLLGYEVQKVYRDNGMRSVNFWTLPQVLGVWPVSILAERRPDSLAYMRLFQIDPNSQDVRRYIAKRFAETHKGAKFSEETEARFVWMREEVSDGFLAAVQSAAIAFAELREAMVVHGFS